MSLDVASRERVVALPRNHDEREPDPITRHFRPVVVPGIADAPKTWVVASFTISSTQPAALSEDDGFVYEGEQTRTRTIRFNVDELSAQFRENLDNALNDIRKEIDAEFASAKALDNAAQQERVPEALRTTPRNARVRVTIYTQSDRMQDMRNAKQEVVAATRIDLHLPVALTPQMARGRISTLMDTARRRIASESGLKL